MRKKKEVPEKVNYFEDTEKYNPFKGIKLKPAAEKPKKAEPLTKKVYDMYTPGVSSVVQKNEQMPLNLLRECSPQDSLDLHGKRPGRDNISSLVNEYLEEAVFKGLKKVEIVAGKGNHSDGEPVVPAIVESALKASEVVMEYENAPSNRGGSGAFWIILGKRSPKPVNVYATEEKKGRDIKGLENVKVPKSSKPPKIDYDSYLPDKDDIR